MYIRAYSHRRRSRVCHGKHTFHTVYARDSSCIRDVNEARTLEAEARTLEAEARTLEAEVETRTLEAKAEAKGGTIQFWHLKFIKFRRPLKKIMEM